MQTKTQAVLDSSANTVDATAVLKSRRLFNVGSRLIRSVTTFRAIATEEERFHIRGNDDSELLTRALKLGLRVAHVPAPVYHLEQPHPYAVGLMRFKTSNQAEYEKVLNLYPERFREYVRDAMNGETGTDG